MADETPRPEELIQIDHRPPKTDWMEVPANIRKGMYCYASNPKSVEYVGLRTRAGVTFVDGCQAVAQPGNSRAAGPDAERAREELAERLADSIHTAFAEGEGECEVRTTDGGRLGFTEHFRCPNHPEIRFAEPTPQLFSFNSPEGACSSCKGFGTGRAKG